MGAHLEPGYIQVKTQAPRRSFGDSGAFDSRCGQTAGNNMYSCLIGRALDYIFIYVYIYYIIIYYILYIIYIIYIINIYIYSCLGHNFLLSLNEFD